MMDTLQISAPPVPDQEKITAAEQSPPPLAPQLRIWILRFLVAMRGYAAMTKGMSSSYSFPALAEALALPSDLKGKKPRERRVELRATLTQQLEAAERVADPTRLPHPLGENIRRIAGVVSLNEVEQHLLAFAMLLHADDSLLHIASETLGRIRTAELTTLLAKVLKFSPKEIRTAIRRDSNLTRSGLVSIDLFHTTTVLGMIDVMSREFVEEMLNHEADPIDFLRGRVHVAPPATLDFSAFDEALPALRRMVLPFLYGSIASSRCGVNLLFVGPPGSGKTESARAIAREIGIRAYDIAYADSDGDNISGAARVRAFNVAQQLLVSTESLLIFDEVTDVFVSADDGFYFGMRRDMPQKAYLNRTLEENKCVAIWISNSPPVDPAVLRRFAAVIEFKPPEEKIRRKMISELTQGVVSEEMVKLLASSPSVSPAVVTAACRLIRDAADWFDQPARDESLRTLVEANLRFSGGKELAKPDDTSNLSFDYYDPKLVNVDIDLVALADSLKRNKRGKVLLAGSPGSGKTAYASWVANRMGAKVQKISLSEALGKFVGDTEKAIASAFEKAQNDEAVLCFDDIDSLLFPRQRAERSWEVTQVNQLLVSIESFSGILVASTNLFDEKNIDQAALRRFDVVLKLGPATPEQLQQQLAHLTRQLELVSPTESELLRISRLDLTPGDFAAVRGRAALLPFKTTEQLVQALERHHEQKNPSHGRRPIGFTP